MIPEQFAALQRLKSAAEQYAVNDPEGFGAFTDVLAETPTDTIVDILKAAEIGAPLMARGIAVPPLDDVSEYVILAVRKGTLTDHAANALQHMVKLISNGTLCVVVAGDEGARVLRVAQLLDEKFASGNGIPVDRITITREEAGM